MDEVTLEAEALKLPERERAILVDHLQQSLSSSRISYLKEHLAESYSRFDTYKSGETESVDGKSFVDGLKAECQK